MTEGALPGVRVLDFTTLLPGPLATRLLAECGASVLKIEPPGGDPMRNLGPRDASGDSIAFQMLNSRKHVRTLDLKNPEGRQQALELARSADVLVEQFRPGVMDRLGLGHATLAALNPRLIYCSITGYGQAGPRANLAGHDLNYMAEAGLLVNSAGADGAPVLPPTLVADIGGGSWPAVMNIALALYRRAQDGKGCRLDISMADNLWPFQLMPLASYRASGRAPRPGAGELSGALARYRLYQTRDGRWLALGALEDRFFHRFAELAGLKTAGVEAPPDALSHGAVARRVREETAEFWLRLCANEDVCVSLVRDVAEALEASPLPALRAFTGRGDHDRPVSPGLPLPLDAVLRVADGCGPHTTGSLNEHGWPAT
jgi:alpha-methylacyl-CoA racemase